jgi:hypothetical protein
LREIAAASDFDFVAIESPRAEKSSARARAKKKAPGGRPSRLGALWRYRTPALGGVLLVALLGLIVVNAMFLQHGRHPAPLFGSTLKLEPPRPPVRPSTLDTLLKERMPGLPLQPVKPAPEAAFAAPVATEAEDAPAAAPPAAPPATPRASAAPANKSHDIIGSLIENGRAVPHSAAGKSVVAAQRALRKLGAAVKPDGDYGAATRKAVETFQRDNHLPVTGELNAATRRQLAARSGMPVD